MADTPKTVTAALGTSRDTLSLGDRYIAFLCFILLGYSVMGKGFAYLGVPPLYVGEMAFLSGIVMLFRTGAVMGTMATLPAVLLLALMALVLARTLPFLGLYGFDALRDSTIIMYGGFTFIIIGLLSIIPTLEFLSWRDAIAAGQVPVMDAATRKRVTMIIHIELAAIVVILLCAAIMARGGWV